MAKENNWICGAVGVLAMGLVVSGCSSGSSSSSTPATTSTSTSSTSSSSSSGSSSDNSNSLQAGPGLIAAGGGNFYDTSSSGGLLVADGDGEYEDTSTGGVLIPIGGGEYIDTATGGVEFSVSAQTKDVDLQQAQVQQQNLQAKAQAMSQEFGMSLPSAVQVTQLADRMSALTSGGKQMTPQDEAALLDAAYAVAGVSGDAVNAAAADYIKTGDQTAVNQLLDQAAVHLGMSSTAALRDEILPSIGINLK